MTRLIKEHESSIEVERVQARLRDLGISVDDPAGHFGKGTVRAVNTFQQQRGILVDGIVGPDTWSELLEASRRLGDVTLYLKRPLMRGDDVLTLQERLNALGFNAGRADGIFGPDTDRAVRAFQREYGVEGDGMFGPRSHAALVGLRVDRPSISAALREELRRTERSDAGLRGALVVLDPGHGGDDPGTLASSGSSEAQLCWDLAARVAERLVGAGAQVRFTRAEIEGPDSTGRAERANELGAELFVSLHLNAHHAPTAKGASTYYFQGSRAAGRLAEAILEELVCLGATNCRAHGRSYSILKQTRMPAVVVEPAFITNPEEAASLKGPEFLRSVADAIVTGLHRYYKALP